MRITIIMIKINFICERCELQSEDIKVSGFVISLDSVPDDFSVFLENGKTIFVCKKCNAQNEHIKNEFLSIRVPSVFGPVSCGNIQIIDPETEGDDCIGKNEWDVFGKKWGSENEN